MQATARTIELVFEPEWHGGSDLAVVQLIPSEVEALIENPVEGAVKAAEGSVVFRERAYPSYMPPPCAAPEPPKVTIPGSTVIEDDLMVEVINLERYVSADGMVTWGGYRSDGTDDFVRTSPIPVGALEIAVHPYPVREDRTAEWRQIAQSDPQRAAVLLRQGASDPLALQAEDLLVLLQSEHWRVREVAQTVVNRIRVSGS